MRISTTLNVAKISQVPVNVGARRCRRFSIFEEGEAGRGSRHRHLNRAGGYVAGDGGSYGTPRKLFTLSHSAPALSNSDADAAKPRFVRHVSSGRLRAAVPSSSRSFVRISAHRHLTPHRKSSAGTQLRLSAKGGAEVFTEVRQMMRRSVDRYAADGRADTHAAPFRERAASICCAVYALRFRKQDVRGRGRKLCRYVEYVYHSPVN